jgi:hypothetical protein
MSEDGVMKQLYAFKKKVRIEVDELTHKIKLLEVQERGVRGEAKRTLKDTIHSLRMLREQFMRDYARVMAKGEAVAERALQRLETALAKLRHACRQSLRLNTLPHPS